MILLVNLHTGSEQPIQESRHLSQPESCCLTRQANQPGQLAPAAVVQAEHVLLVLGLALLSNMSNTPGPFPAPGKASLNLLTLALSNSGC